MPTLITVHFFQVNALSPSLRYYSVACPHPHGITVVYLQPRGITVNSVTITTDLPRFSRCPHPHAAIYSAYASDNKLMIYQFKRGLLWGYVQKNGLGLLQTKSERNKQIEWEVVTNTGRCTFSPWTTNTGKNNRRTSTFHSTGAALCLSLCCSFL